MKKNTTTFFGALLGAGLMSIIDIFFFQSSFGLFKHLIQPFLVAIFVTLGFAVFRYIFKKNNK